MATIQSQLLQLALRVDPRTKRNQVFQGSDAAVNVSGVATNGAGLFRVTTSTPHNLRTNDQAYIIGVVGTGGMTAAINNTLTNPNWTVTRISATEIDLQSSTFTGVYTSGGTVTGALIGSVDGNFTRQRLVDIYNDARNVLAGFIYQKYGKKKAFDTIQGVVIANTDIAFASGAATKPTGFIGAVLLRDPSGDTVSIVNASALPSVQEYDAPRTKFVYDAGTQFLAQSTTVITDDAHYKLWYYGITDITIADVVATTRSEVFNTDWLPRIIDLAEAIALEEGGINPLSLASKMFEGVK